MGQAIVDAGQSGIRVYLSKAGRTDVSLEFPGVRAHDNVLLQVAQVVAESIGNFGSHDDWTVAAGITGLTAIHGGANTLLLALPTSVTRVVIGHDSATSYLGALGNAPGAVLAVGTGVVVTACAAATTARVDGWGHLFGDAGGGFWIGSRGLTAVLEAEDGRALSTSLTAAAIARFGAIDTLPSIVYENPDRVAAVAAFCIDVVACAEHGDSLADGILTEGARQLARSAQAALEAVGLAEDSRVVSWSGNLIQGSNYVRRLIRTELASLPVAASLVAPVGTPLDGARALINLPATHPLYGEVTRAYRNEK
ncbi:N-acetylglucosamine kinase [Cryobacterium sp. TMT1-66-1]|uniref:N-acetylglucosamine kinase n=1 Tax=Cryobacterium sp. TMT1-66-1 TaxID=1259242 RepID=UPI00106B0403|nr:BadF/BadG/BcrA/BcrD ATPase family protein [Cryobacterium sp. TMT1-66-1]TFD07819.1 ATPase [Cryobacterium sp. TMT1-66-1]